MNRYFKYLLLIILGIFINILGLHAQDTARVKHSKIEIIKKDDYFNDRGKKSSANQKKNIIKIDILLPLFEGEGSIFYERKLSEHVSAELGVGVNFSYWWYDFLHNGEFSIDLPTSSNSTVANGIGMTLRGQIRYYFDASEYPEGWYAAAGFVHKTFPVNYNLTYFPASGSFSEVTQAFPNINTYDNYLLFVGRQFESSRDNLFFDWQIGVGIANYNKGLITATDNGGNVGNFNFTNTSYTGFAYSVSFKAGYAF